MKPEERFLKYTAFDTQSDGESGSHPSTKRQLELAEYLKRELQEIGISDVVLTDDCYVYAKIPASAGYETRKKLGFIAHMDTSPDFSGENVRARVIANYDGGDVPLGDSGLVLSPKSFPHLSAWRGRTLITTDGKTLLGADDKAGIAEIMTLAEELTASGLPHGPVRIAFTPDEEIGEGADGFDLSLFDADFAYTADGDLEGGLEYENFNAASAVFEVQGVNVHPGTAKDIMVNAALVATEIARSLPKDETPAKTEGYEGFFHLTEMTGNVERAKLSYIVRDHDKEKFEEKLKTLNSIAEAFIQAYGEGTVRLTIQEQYRNMREKIEENFHLVENAKIAAKRCGIESKVAPIRGGTDGARLSFMGLPCPNLGTGGFAFHGPYEHVSVEGMRKATEILLTIVSIYSEF